MTEKIIVRSLNDLLDIGKNHKDLDVVIKGVPTDIAHKGMRSITFYVNDIYMDLFTEKPSVSKLLKNCRLENEVEVKLRYSLREIKEYIEESDSLSVKSINYNP
ncbi:hypothetical protein KAJ38_03280 [Candidatus Pacearchaeota archaeon]|nr:hypothetical protein [Candidatus Pacearchaeota archaeon]